MEHLNNVFNGIPAVFRNKYALVLFAFVIWMTFFDNYNFIYRTHIFGELKEARVQKRYYQKQIKEVNADLTDLFSTEASLEKFAREKYFMKRDNEDVFIIVNK